MRHQIMGVIEEAYDILIYNNNKTAKKIAAKSIFYDMPNQIVLHENIQGATLSFI